MTGCLPTPPNLLLTDAIHYRGFFKDISDGTFLKLHLVALAKDKGPKVCEVVGSK